MDATADPRETVRHGGHLYVMKPNPNPNSNPNPNPNPNPNQVRHGEHLYVMKPTMKSSKKSEGKGTWSDDEYAHPGLQVT